MSTSGIPQYSKLAWIKEAYILSGKRPYNTPLLYQVYRFDHALFVLWAHKVIPNLSLRNSVILYISVNVILNWLHAWSMAMMTDI